LKHRQRYSRAGLELRKGTTECRPFSVSGKATLANRANSRVAAGLGVVEDPVHVRKQCAREPGDLQGVCASRPVREGERSMQPWYGLGVYRTSFGDELTTIRRATLRPFGWSLLRLARARASARSETVVACLASSRVWRIRLDSAFSLAAASFGRGLPPPESHRSCRAGTR
jgi:hypothetical protein